MRTPIQRLCCTTAVACAIAACDPPPEPTTETSPEAVVPPRPALTPPEHLDLQLDDYIADWGRHWPSFRFHGVVSVGLGGETVAERAYGFSNLSEEVRNAPGTPFRIGTLSVHLAVATTLSLVQDGTIALGDPAKKWAPNAGLPASITVEHLLTHTSGLKSFAERLTFNAEKRRPITHDALVAGVSQEPLEFEPGTDFAPSTTNAAVLGLVIEGATGSAYPAAVRTHVLEPAGMTHTHWVTDDDLEDAGLQFDEAEHLVPVSDVDPRAFGAAGAWISNASDLQQLYGAITGGDFGSGAALERAYGSNPHERPYGFVEGTVGGERSLLWLGLIDGHNSAVLLVPEDELCIVVLGNAEVTPASEVAMTAAGLVYGETPARREEPREVPVSAEDLAALQGTWTMTARSYDAVVNAVPPETVDSLKEISVTFEPGTSGSGRLWVAIDRGSFKWMHPQGRGRFFFKDLPQSTARTGVTSTGIRTLTLERDGSSIHYRLRPGGKTGPGAATPG